MMLRRSCVLLLVLCIPFVSLGSEVPLPELTGEYAAWFGPAPSGRTTYFEFSEEIQSAEGVRFILTGEWTEGVMVCESFGSPPDTFSFVPGLSMYLWSEEGFEGNYHTTVLPVDGEFVIESDFFEYSENGDITQLFGEVILAELFCDQVLPGNCFVINDSFGALFDVRIEILGAVATENLTWGQVKALFR